MLVEFSVGNYKSFKDIQTLHLQAGNLKSKDGRLEESNTFQANDKFRLLKSKLIYGANDSGKSNLIRAMIAMLIIIDNSFKDDQVIKYYAEPYLFFEDSNVQPTYFQISIVLDGVYYRYGMEVSDGKVVSEWLFGTPGRKEVRYFVRQDMYVELNKNQFKEATKLLPDDEDDVPIYSETSLFLSVAAASQRRVAKRIVDFIRNDLGVFTGVNMSTFTRHTTLKYLDHPAFKSDLINLLSDLDIKISGVEKAVFDVIDHNPGETTGKAKVNKREVIFLRKPSINGEEEVLFNLDTHEAEGTKKIIELAPGLLSTLKQGKVLVLDELDARLHPRLSRKIVELFNSKETNPNNAQLIAVTHDTNLMDANLLRRDQICFVDRDKNRSSFIYSLAEYKGVRNDAPFEKDYLKGKYGAVPFVNRVDDLFIHQTATEDA